MAAAEWVAEVEADLGAVAEWAEVAAEVAVAEWVVRDNFGTRADTLFVLP